MLYVFLFFQVLCQYTYKSQWKFRERWSRNSQMNLQRRKISCKFWNNNRFGLRRAEYPKTIQWYDQKTRKSFLSRTEDITKSKLSVSKDDWNYHMSKIVKFFSISSWVIGLRRVEYPKSIQWCFQKMIKN